MAGQLRTIHTVGRWQGEAGMAVPLDCDGQRYGLISLGPRTAGEPYTRQEGELLAQVRPKWRKRSPAPDLHPLASNRVGQRQRGGRRGAPGVSRCCIWPDGRTAHRVLEPKKEEDHDLAK